MWVFLLLPCSQVLESLGWPLAQPGSHMGEDISFPSEAGSHHQLKDPSLLAAELHCCFCFSRQYLTM